jgi:hypothetical protein
MENYRQIKMIGEGAFGKVRSYHVHQLLCMFHRVQFSLGLSHSNQAPLLEPFLVVYDCFCLVCRLGMEPNPSSS